MDMTQSDPDFELLLKFLKEARGFDFTGYKRSSLSRRIDHRMSQIAVSSYNDYLDFVQVHPEEFTTLFNTILINVTRFFRDPAVWEHLATDWLAPMLANLGPDGPIRVWSAGCATGEEAYTIAMIMGDLLGVQALRDRVKIYATDVDDNALVHARQALYTEQDLTAVPPDTIDRYFDRTAAGFSFRKDFRRSVIFGRNDLVRDAPISRVDLLVCRNTLMYFTAEMQAQILHRLHFALKDTGLLFLGKAEMLLSHAHQFQPVDLPRRVFRKVVTAAGDATATGSRAQPTEQSPGGMDRLREEAFAASPVAQIVVTSDGLVAMTNRLTEKLLGVSARDIGRPFRDLDVSYRPVDLRRHIDQAQVERRAVRIEAVDYMRAPGETLCLDIQVEPVIGSDSGLLGVTLMFRDITEARDLRTELERLHGQLEAAYEELQSTNEELETTNEELQSTVEELETTNEELQSTNEELETMNEELHSTNDELQAVNDALRTSNGQVEAANVYLDAVLGGLRAAVAVIDRDLLVRLWNRRAEDLWGVRRDEAIGEHFFNLDIGLPTDQLRPMIRATFTGGADTAELELSAVNRRGRSIALRVVCSAVTFNGDGAAGAVLVMEEGAAAHSV
jgi:two-component system, chemotaxis family, CheB/CheR fusion protein